MIDVKKLKNNFEEVREKLKRRNFDDFSLLKKTISDYDLYIKTLQETELKREKLNKINAKIKSNLGNKEIFSELKNESKFISKSMIDLNNKLTTLKNNLFEDLYQIPNIPSKSIPQGTEENNVVLQTFGEEIIIEDSIPSYEFLEKHDYINKNISPFISGTRLYIYNERLLDLYKKLESELITIHKNSHYEGLEIPVIVNEESLYNSGHLPKFKKDLYQVSESQYLIPTGEAILVNMGRNKIYKEQELPKKLFTSSLCFRKESDSTGKDTRGIIRMHQFRKVELVVFGKMEDEEKIMNNMLKQASKILDKYKITYRWVKLAAAEISFAARKTIDIEVWMPGSKKWVEISSVSSTGNYQTRRLNTKYKSEIDKKKHLTYAFNGSALALDRLMAVFIEYNLI